MYIPSLGEVLEGLHRAMEESVIPAIEDEYARIQAARVSVQLRDLAERWERLPEWLATENEEARSGLAGCVEAMEGAAPPGREGEVRALVDALRRQLACRYSCEPPRRGVESLVAERQNLGCAMEQAVLGLEALQRSDPSNPGLREARRQLRRVMLAQAGPHAPERRFP
ncbi:MAG: hypothetical protein V3V35_03150 [Dehalococcoidia bacterium]